MVIDIIHTHLDNPIWWGTAAEEEEGECEEEHQVENVDLEEGNYNLGTCTLVRAILHFGTLVLTILRLGTLAVAILRG